MSKLLKKLNPYLLVLPAVTVVLLFIVYPVLISIMKSFQMKDSGLLTLENYQYFLTNKLQQSNIVFTLYVVCITCILSVGFGYLLALYIRFGKTKLSKWVAILNLIPRFIPGLVAVYAGIIFIRDSGVIYRLGLLFGQEWKIGFMYDAKGIILMNSWFNIPFACMIISAGLASIPNSIIESAKDIGASKLTVFKKVIFPLSYKDMLVAMTFIFMGNVGSFTTPYLIGGNAPKMLGIVLYEQFNYMDYEKAAALSVIMFILCSLSASVYIYTNIKKEKWENQ